MTEKYALTIGETMGLFNAERLGRMTRGDDYRFSLGGSEGNTAIGLVRLGSRCVWISRVGDDEIGRAIIETTRGEGVDVRAVVDPEAQTGLMYRTRRLPGHTSVVYYRAGSAASRLTPADVDPELLRGAAVVHVSGITPALSASAAETIDYCVDTARAASVPVSFDVNYRSRLWGPEAADALRKLARRSDIVLAGGDEAALITGETELESQLAVFGEWGVSEAIVKRGENGASALIRGERFDAAGVPIEVVDTVGAGDAFTAGYLHGWLAGDDAQTRLDLANRVAAFVCSAEGDWEGLPSPEELSLFEADETVIR